MIFIKTEESSSACVLLRSTKWRAEDGLPLAELNRRGVQIGCVTPAARLPARGNRGDESHLGDQKFQQLLSALMSSVIKNINLRFHSVKLNNNTASNKRKKRR